MKNRITMAAASIIALAAWPALAGPFGIEMGDPISKYKYKTTDSPYRYTLTQVPTPFPDADFYSVIATPETGVCKISMATKDFDNDSYGSKVQAEYEKLKKSLTDRYGSPTDSFDFLRSGSIWDESRDYAMSLKVDERVLSSFWAPKGKPVSGDIATITLEATATSGTSTYLAVRYEFKNTDRCFEIMDAAKSKGL